jgi:hypothetical protein
MLKDLEHQIEQHVHALQSIQAELDAKLATIAELTAALSSAHHEIASQDNLHGDAKAAKEQLELTVKDLQETRAELAKVQKQCQALELAAKVQEHDMDKLKQQGRLLQKKCDKRSNRAAQLKDFCMESDLDYPDTPPDTDEEDTRPKRSRSKRVQSVFIEGEMNVDGLDEAQIAAAMDERIFLNELIELSKKLRAQESSTVDDLITLARLCGQLRSSFVAKSAPSARQSENGRVEAGWVEHLLPKWGAIVRELEVRRDMAISEPSKPYLAHTPRDDAKTPRPLGNPRPKVVIARKPRRSGAVESDRADPVPPPPKMEELLELSKAELAELVIQCDAQMQEVLEETEAAKAREGSAAMHASVPEVANDTPESILVKKLRDLSKKAASRKRWAAAKNASTVLHSISSKGGPALIKSAKPPLASTSHAAEPGASLANSSADMEVDFNVDDLIELAGILADARRVVESKTPQAAFETVHKLIEKGFMEKLQPCWPTLAALLLLAQRPAEAATIVPILKALGVAVPDGMRGAQQPPGVEADGLDALIPTTATHSLHPPPRTDAKPFAMQTDFWIASPRSAEVLRDCDMNLLLEILKEPDLWTLDEKAQPEPGKASHGEVAAKLAEQRRIIHANRTSRLEAEERDRCVTAV